MDNGNNQTNYQNNYMICPNCKQYVPYGSAFCNRCGMQFQYNTNQYQYDNAQKTKRKESALSIIAGVIGIIGFLISFGLSIFGLIIGVIDLAIGQSKQYDNERHDCSWFAITVGIIGIVINTIIYLV